MSAQQVVRLSDDERRQCHALIYAGTAPARSITHTQVLLKTDASAEGPAWTDEAITEAFQVSTVTVAPIRKTMCHEGLAAAWRHYRTGQRQYRRRLDGHAEAHLVALALLLAAAPLAAAAQPSAPRFVPLIIVLNGIPMEDVRGCGMVEWHPQTKWIEIRDAHVVLIKEGQRQARRVRYAQPAEPFLLEAPPTRWQGTLYVPVSLDRELGWQVAWNAAKGEVAWTCEEDGQTKTYRHVRMDLALVAAQKHDLAALRRRLRASPQIVREKSWPYTLLHWAAARGDVPVMRVLLDAGADVNALASTNSWVARGRQVLERGETPLHLAARAGHVEAARFLLARKAALSIQDDDYNTPLHLVAQGGHVEMARLLLQHGADVSATARFENMPLHLAAQAGDVPMAALLLAAGARATARNSDGEKPANESIHLAAGAGNLALVRLLVYSP